jgi:hypothetical protein
MKEAAKDRHHRSLASISTALKKGTASGGHYFFMWHDCPDTLKELYLQDNTLPDPSVWSNSLTVERIHPLSNEVKKYSSIAHIQTEMRISRGTIKRAIEERSILRGYYWREVCHDGP